MADYFDDDFYDSEDDWEGEDYSEYFGVAGPGDEFFSVGPHGESSLAAQMKAHDDTVPDMAMEGAAANAVDAVLSNMGDDQGQFQNFEPAPAPAPSGGGGGFLSSSPSSSSSFPGDSAMSSPSSSKLSLPLILGVVAGALVVFWKKF